MVAGVCGTEVDAPAVQLEPAVTDSQVAEPGAHVLFVRGVAVTIRLQSHTDEVEEWVVNVPRPHRVRWHLQFDVDDEGLTG